MGAASAVRPARHGEDSGRSGGLAEADGGQVLLAQGGGVEVELRVVRLGLDAEIVGLRDWRDRRIEECLGVDFQQAPISRPGNGAAAAANRCTTDLRSEPGPERPYLGMLVAVPADEHFL